MSDIDLELARQRGNRHRLASSNLAGRFEANEKVAGRVRLTAATEVAQTIGGQHALWMLANLLARQFAVIREIEIVVPPVPLQPGVALFGEAADLPSTLALTVQLVAGAAMALVSPDPAKAADVEVSAGRTAPADRAVVRVGVLGSGWNLAVGDPGFLPNVLPTGTCAFGPYFAACLAAGETFKHLSGLRAGKGRFIDSLRMSLWDWQERESWDELPEPEPSSASALPSFYMIGAGAVGQAAAAALAGSRQPMVGMATIIDGDIIDREGTNLNRYPLATLSDLGKPKASFLADHLNQAGIRARADDRHWPAYAFESQTLHRDPEVATLEANYRYRIVLSCVDKNPARHAIQNFWPEYLIGGSTSDLALAVAAYDMRSEFECLKCSNPVETTGPTIHELTADLKRLSTHEQVAWAKQRGLDPKAVVEYLADPRCGTLGEQEISKFARRGGANDWSVGFVSVAAGTLLAAQLVKYTINGPVAFFETGGNTLRLSLLNPRPRYSSHRRNPACECSTTGRDQFTSLWGDQASPDHTPNAGTLNRATSP